MKSSGPGGRTTKASDDTASSVSATNHHELDVVLHRQKRETFRKRSTQRELFRATFPQKKAFGRRPNPSKREVHTTARTPRERKSLGGAPSKGGAQAALA